MTNPDSGHAIGKPIFAGPLTKKALFAMPDATYLTSNCYLSCNPPIPIITAYVPTEPEAKEAFWKKLRQRGLPGTRFYAFRSQREYQVWLRFRNGRPTVEALVANS